MALGCFTCVILTFVICWPWAMNFHLIISNPTWTPLRADASANMVFWTRGPITVIVLSFMEITTRIQRQLIFFFDIFSFFQSFLNGYPQKQQKRRFNRSTVILCFYLSVNRKKELIISSSNHLVLKFLSLFFILVNADAVRVLSGESKLK